MTNLEAENQALRSKLAAIKHHVAYARGWPYGSVRHAIAIRWVEQVLDGTDFRSAAERGGHIPTEKLGGSGPLVAR